MCRTTLEEGGDPGNLLWLNERITGSLAAPAAAKPAVSDIPPILHQALAGRYVLQRELGRGGAATVYLAHDVRHERLVAIKVLHPELSHALGAQRFLREIKLTASLQHPHILPIHDSGQADAQLYYVMPYVEGESLRQRLGADNRLSIEEAVRIGREVAGALAYAHERGVVHRDIKPENILFSGGHAVLADFGIARAINRASEKITQQGTITGTPAYMSPEQARDRDFDGRSDVYSLACVLYEAIAGVPPFSGDTPQQLLSQRIVKTPPPLRQFRYDVPAPIETVIAKALAISPDDRYDDARGFSAALSAAIGNSGETLTERPRRRPLSRNPWAWAAGVTLLVAGGAATSPRARDGIDVLTRRVDRSAYAVLPFQYVGADAPSHDAEPVANGVYDAMRRWDGLHLASDMSVSDAVRRQGVDSLTLADVARVARLVHAGRAVWGRVRITGDSLVLRAGVYDALTGESVRQVTRVVRPLRAGAVDAIDFKAVASDLLRVARPAALSALADRGTSSFAAWQAFDRGILALGRWDLGSATTGFEDALVADPGYPQANLWLAQVKFWSGAPLKEWAPAIIAADRGRVALDVREQTLADALGAIAQNDHPRGCRAYDALRARDSLDAVVWLGLAMCEGRDETVIPSVRSASGWAFRGSTERAWRAVTRAVEIEPESFAVVTYDWLQHIAPVENNRLRIGHSASGAFAAVPTLVGRSVEYTPYPMGQFAGAHWPAGYDAALRFDRDRMLGLLQLVTSRSPENANAFEALASLLETRDEITGTPDGRYSALTALERARGLATAPAQRLRLAVADVRLHLKLGDFARSASTADSVLRSPGDTSVERASLLAGLAAYTGHAALAARYQRLGTIRQYHGDVAIPAAEEALSALLMRAALGICDDSIAMLAASVERTLGSYVGASDRTRMRDQLLERPLMLAGPCSGGRTSLRIGTPMTPVMRAQQLAANDDRAGVRRMLDSMQQDRRDLRPGSIAFDYLLQEAWLRDVSGDPAGAAAALDVILSALPTLSTYVVTEPVMAASIGRGMAYRADLAARLNDPSTAALWAGRVLTVWARADANLQPTLQHMRQLASRRPAQ
jgi:tRNA A-37 threonylcarbamoyl transferase component Bud32